MRSRAVEYGGCRLLYRYVSSIVYGRLLTQDVLSQNPPKKKLHIYVYADDTADFFMWIRYATIFPFRLFGITNQRATLVLDCWVLGVWA